MCRQRIAQLRQVLPSQVRLRLKIARAAELDADNALSPLAEGNHFLQGCELFAARFASLVSGWQDAGIGVKKDEIAGTRPGAAVLEPPLTCGRAKRTVEDCRRQRLRVEDGTMRQNVSAFNVRETQERTSCCA